jgi:dihydrofolate synthase/folylpolyglutamate synthase
MGQEIDQEIKKAVDFLYEIPKFTKKNSLEHTRILMQQLGNPAGNCKVIHVAGSNGKGSVCCFLYHMLLLGKKNVGLFTSPHLMDIRERFQINGELCTKEAFLEAFDRVKKAAEKIAENNLSYPTFFEFIFAMGMVIFELAQTEYVILETGLGGRLDATNSFEHPILTVITSISLEHTEYLGDTIEQIAGEKAGIVKAGVPLVFDGNEPKAAQVMKSRAESLKSPWIGITKDLCKIREIKNNLIDFSLSTAYDKGTRWTIPFSAAYQVDNAALAITAIRVLGELFPEDRLDKTVMQEGMLHAQWPGRMQEVAPGVYFDGAHNTGGIAVFIEAVKTLTKEDAYPPLLLFSMVKEKDYLTSVNMLTSELEWEEMAVTRIPDDRGISFEKLQEIFEKDSHRPVAGYADYREALSEMMKKRKEGQKLFCTGSLYFVGALMGALKEDET